MTEISKSKDDLVNRARERLVSELLRSQIDFDTHNFKISLFKEFSDHIFSHLSKKETDINNLFYNIDMLCKDLNNKIWAQAVQVSLGSKNWNNQDD